jgi:hypothetical protein
MKEGTVPAGALLRLKAALFVVQGFSPVFLPQALSRSPDDYHGSQQTFWQRRRNGNHLVGRVKTLRYILEEFAGFMGADFNAAFPPQALFGSHRRLHKTLNQKE